MQRILATKTRKQLRRFLGMVNYYRYVWKRRSHVLAPLATLAGRSAKKYIWTDEHQNAFESAKNMISREAMLAYPDFSQEFHVYADASDYQLGGLIMQENKPHKCRVYIFVAYRSDYGSIRRIFSLIHSGFSGECHSG